MWYQCACSETNCLIFTINFMQIPFQFLDNDVNFFVNVFSMFDDILSCNDRDNLLVFGINEILEFLYIIRSSFYIICLVSRLFKIKTISMWPIFHQWKHKVLFIYIHLTFKKYSFDTNKTLWFRIFRFRATIKQVHICICIW